jgi:hypothetical protein
VVKTHRDLVFIIPGESFNISPSWSLEALIERAERRGDETFKIQTKDGFTVYERFYHHNLDGSKDVVSKSYLREDELTPKEAVETMLNGERLVDYEHTPDIAQYRWNGENFIVYDSYYYDSEEVITKFTGLRHIIVDENADEERERIRVKEILGFELDLSNLPMVKRQYSPKGAMQQAIIMCEANKWNITEAHIYSVLADLDSDLTSMLS